MPSFQSPVPISGRPCAPVARLIATARAQCSYSEARSPRDGRTLVGFVLGRIRAGGPRGRTLFIEHAVIAGGRDVFERRVDEPQAVVRKPGADALPPGSCHQCCTSPSTNCRDAACSKCVRASRGAARSRASTSCNWSRKPNAPLD
jgi:hypothetical protein